MQVALVYDRLNKLGGAERVLAAFHRLYPRADWYTSVWDLNKTPFTQNWQVHPSFINRIPFLRRRHELIPFLMPFIFESFDFSGYDLVISIGSAEAKGIITRPETLHLNYCLTPTRYLWSHRQEYLESGQFGILQHWLRPLVKYLFDFLARWDRVAANRPDVMISISQHVKTRVKKYYNRSTEVIYPPVDTKKFTFSSRLPSFPSLSLSPYYLTVSRLVPYKRLSLLLRAFVGTPRRLVIVGTGSEYRKLVRQAPANVTLVGRVAEAELLKYYQNCRAFLQVNEEDFGIGMVEALASGKPVIAFRQGGAAEIVDSGVTGILFSSPTPVAIRRALDKFETMTFSARACRQSARRFDFSAWQSQIKHAIGAAWINHQKNLR